MSIVTEKLTDEELESLRRRTPGEVPLEILALLEEKNLLIWLNNSRYGLPAGFLSLSSGNLVENLLPPIKLYKAKSALTALFKREYIDSVSSSRAIEMLNEGAVRSGILPYRGANESSMRNGVQEKRSVPWSYSTDIFEISREGKLALAGFTTRLNRLRQRERSLIEQPRFVITKRLDQNGRQYHGACCAYRIEKETPGRVYVKDLEDTDGFPKMQWGDRALQIENTGSGGHRVRYIEKGNVLLMNATVENYIALKQATEICDQEISAALKVKADDILPFEEAFRATRANSLEKMRGMVTDIERNKKDEALVDTANEEGFVLSLDEDNGFSI